MNLSVTFEALSRNRFKLLENDAITKPKGNGAQRACNQHVPNMNDDDVRLLIKTYEMMNELQKQKDELEKELNKFKQKEIDTKQGNLNTDVALTSSSIVVSFKGMEDKDKEVQKRTGFWSLKHMLGYIILICNGNHYTMTKNFT